MLKLRILYSSTSPSLPYNVMYHCCDPTYCTIKLIPTNTNQYETLLCLSKCLIISSSGLGLIAFINNADCRLNYPQQFHAFSIKESYQNRNILALHWNIFTVSILVVVSAHSWIIHSLTLPYICYTTINQTHPLSRKTNSTHCHLTYPHRCRYILPESAQSRPYCLLLIYSFQFRSAFRGEPARHRHCFVTDTCGFNNSIE